MSDEMVEKRLAGIVEQLNEIKMLLFQNNVVPAPPSIDCLADMVASGDFSALRRHNKSKRAGRSQ